MAQTQYRIRVRRGDIEVEIEGDKSYVNRAFAELKRLVLGLEEPSTAGSPKSQRAAKAYLPSAKPQSVREFLDSYDLKKHTDIVLAFGYYLEKRRVLSSFSPGDLNGCYYEAKLEPSNTSQMIINNTKKGLIMDAPGSKKKKRKYILTRKGERFVEAGFVQRKK